VSAKQDALPALPANTVVLSHCHPQPHTQMARGEYVMCVYLIWQQATLYVTQESCFIGNCNKHLTVNCMLTALCDHKAKNVNTSRRS